MDTQSVLFGLLQVAVCGAPATEALKENCTQETLEKVYTLAARHDIAHLVGQAVSKLELPESEIAAKCKQAALQAFMRYMRLDYAYGAACKALEVAQIPFIPLKGSVLRDDYPEPWMRTSCDVDILVRVEHLGAAIDVLTKTQGYTVGERTDHDISMHSVDGVHLELHYDTIQARYESGTNRSVLAQIWDYAQPKTPGGYHMMLLDDMFYFYHMAHMSKHFKNGGCGIRAFLDIWIMNQKDHDRAAREKLLEEGGMLPFARGAEQVAQYWFSSEEPDANTRAVSDYILRAGIYGDRANRAAVGQAKSGGKFKYLLTRRIFMPYEFLKDEYPILKKHKWLMPAYQVVRWVRMLLRGELSRTVAEWKANTANDRTATEDVANILQHLGL